MNYRTLSRSALAVAICLSTLAIAAPNEAAAQGIQFRVNTGGYGYGNGYRGGYVRGYRTGYRGYGANQYRAGNYGYSRYGTGRYGYGSSTRYVYPSSSRYGSRRGASFNVYYGQSRSYGPYGYRSN